MGVFGRPHFKNADVSQLPFVIPNDLIAGTPSKVMGLDGWPDHKYPRKISYKVTLMESALEICRHGKAVAYLPEFVVRLQNKILKKEFELVELECPISKKERLQSVFIVQNSSGEETTLIRAIAKALRAIS
jgi:DNA-binding transcriptional LysR family regulator